MWAMLGSIEFSIGIMWYERTVNVAHLPEK